MKHSQTQRWNYATWITSMDKTQIEHEIDMVKTDMQEMINYQTLGAIIRSKAKWYQEGEKIYFLDMEKINYIKKSSKKTSLTKWYTYNRQGRDTIWIKRIL